MAVSVDGSEAGIRPQTALPENSSSKLCLVLKPLVGSHIGSLTQNLRGPGDPAMCLNSDILVSNWFSGSSPLLLRLVPFFT